MGCETMRLFSIAGLLVAVSLTTPTLLWAADVDYVRDVKSILAARCFGCHGALKRESNLRLDTAKLAIQGGDSGTAIVPGKPDASRLLKRIVSTDDSNRMPPEGDRLTADEMSTIRSWIAQGAKSPRDEKPQPEPGGHWSFRPVTRSDVPKTKNTGWVRNSIDAFISSRHAIHGLSPRPTASKQQLLRRVYLDLTGLPPTRKELRAFLANDADDAYEQVVDRLLKSPQYGERWARHWMDVWRYSDWYGRRSVNDVRNSAPHIWRWRDWIVRSLNEDKGYDRMVQEMLAADEIAPADDATVVATGFVVRNWFSLNYDVWKRDLVEHTGKAFLGLRFNCAHCHDHKYDPITQEDYFRFRAFFEPLEFRHDRVPGGPDLPKYKKYVPGSGGSLKPTKAGLSRVFDVDLEAKTYLYHGGDARNKVKEHGPIAPGPPKFFFPSAMRIEPVDLPTVAHQPGLRPFVRQEETKKRQSAIVSAEKTLAAAKNELAALQTATPSDDAPVLAEKLASMRRRVVLNSTQLDAARKALAAFKARVVADESRHALSADNREAFARTASKSERIARLASLIVAQLVAEDNVRNAQAKAAADPKASAAVKKAEVALVKAKKNVAAAEKALTTESTQYTPLGPSYPAKSSGRRTALGRWITGRENPLTARVAINYIWMRHFGKPLVESVSDFGMAGKSPSHPQLLNWLAVELMGGDRNESDPIKPWRMKRLHRLIVTSNTYRMQSQPAGLDDPNYERDADNVFLWRFPARRLEAEALRDSMLHVAGTLDLTLGGPELLNTQGETTHRRTLYYLQHPEAGGTMGFMTSFDPPDPGSCYRRTDSTVPQQALAMTNSRLAIHYGRLLAGKVWKDVKKANTNEATREAAFVTHLFEQMLTRRPTNAESKIVRVFLTRQTELYRQSEVKVTTSKGTVAASTDPRMRARESLARSLFSHHDFVTLK